MAPVANPRVSLFVTCLVDQLYPQVGVSTVRLLRRLGATVDFPRAQTCCGQPIYNGGFQKAAASLARRFLDIFEDAEYVVAPSGSCATMVKVFYPELFKDDEELRRRALALAERTYELTQFIVNVMGVRDVGASATGRVAFHASCHLLRELGVRTEPRLLLGNVRGIEMVELPDAETCCGFGGTFSVKMPHLAGAMLDDKIANAGKSGADTLVANDMGCLMHIAGGMSRKGVPVRAMHIAEILEKQG